MGGCASIVTLNQPSQQSLSSGFLSQRNSTDSGLADLPDKHTSTMEKILKSRSSVLIGNANKKKDEDDLVMEAKVMKSKPALKEVFNGFNECNTFLMDTSKRDEKYFGQMDNYFGQGNKVLQDKLLQVFKQYETTEQRTVMGNKLARIGIVGPLIELYDFAQDFVDVDAITNAFVEECRRTEDASFELILTIREILWNYSDSSHSFSEQICTTNIFEKLVKDLKCIYDGECTQLSVEEDLFALNSAVGIIHNCARNPDIDKELFRNVGVMDALYPFLKSEVSYVKMVTLLALGNIITEQEVSTLATDMDAIDFLLKAITKAVTSKDRMAHGFHLSELLDGLAAIAQSEQNKSKIMSKQPLEIISKIIDGKLDAEVVASVKLIWELSFLQENKNIIKKNKKLLGVLDKLRNDQTNNSVYAVARSAWFVLIEKDQRLHDVPAPMVHTPKEETKLGNLGKHIMISYCWSDKDVVYKIYRELKNAGYSIWIDIEEMNRYTNLLEGMAKAVEDAFVILVCFSERYKDSRNCRTEADYAYSRQKEILPIKLQRGYNPDGWLGALIGARLYIEFSGHYPFDDKMRELKATIPTATTEHLPLGSPKNPLPEPTLQGQGRLKVTDWTQQEIKNWLNEYNMNASQFKKVWSLTGPNLQFLHKVANKAPDTFYKWAEEKLGLSKIDDYMIFDKAIHGLDKYV